MRGTPKNQEFIYKKLFILTRLNSSHFQSTLHLMQSIHLLGFFPHCSKQFLNSSILMPFSASAIFCFTSLTSAKCCPLRTFFIWGNKTNQTNKQTKCLGQDWVNREAGAQRSSPFWQTLLNIYPHVGRCACKSPITK